VIDVDLSDIQKARAEFADLDKRYHRAANEHLCFASRESMQKWAEVSMPLHDEYAQLCAKYFGTIPENESGRIAPEFVLGWIEKFLKAES
jgi:hypothetical protein